MKPHYLKALHEHQAGNTEAAEQLYRKLLVDEPENADVMHLLSILLAQRQDFSAAEQLMGKALKLEPASPTYHNSMGNIQKNLKHFDSAIGHYKQAIKLQPSNAAAYNNLGTLLYKMDRLTQAKECYETALKLRPQYPDASYNLSLVLRQQELKEDAIKHLEATIKFQPGYGPAHQQLAHLLQLRGDLDRAAYHYQRAVRCDAANFLAHHNLAVTLISKGKYAAAVRHLLKVLTLQPGHPEALHNMGALFLLQSKPAAALPYFLQLTQISKEFEALYNIGVIYMDLGRLDDAITYLQEALALRPDDFSCCMNLGTIYLRRNDYKLAKNYYHHALIIQPENQEVAYLLAALEQNSVPDGAPSEYIEHLFDQYAPHFEQHLKLLDYKVPELLFDAVCKINVNKKSLFIIDIGCGTGLCGARFKPMADKFVGIDLSEKMLAIARQKNIYTELKHSSLEEGLADYHDADLILAADSLVYFGDLVKIFQACWRALKDGGLFAFTIEATDHYPFVLQRSARFAHANKYINAAARKTGFTVLTCDEVVLRKQYGAPINGSVCILCKV